MKQRLVDILVCPGCTSPFELSIEQAETRSYPHWRERLLALHGLRDDQSDPAVERLITSYETEVIAGRLTCPSCRADYPILDGIPRILPPELRTAPGLGRGNPLKDERLSSFMDQAAPLSSTSDEFTNVQKANQSNYGYEWQAFSHEYDQWEVVYSDYYVHEPAENFQNKLGLDAGCGMGRYTLVAAKRGAEMIGVDLSNAVEAAYRKSLDVPTFHVVQGDIYNLPIREASVDFAQTLGVIHIAPDPERALESIRSRVKPGGKVFVYVYPTFEDENRFKFHLLRLIREVRKVTVRLPSSVLYKLLYLVVPFILVFCYFPSWVLWKIPATRSISNAMPYNYEQFRGRKLRDFHMNLFDRFGNPLERRYGRADMDDWMKRKKISDYELRFKDGWMLSFVQQPDNERELRSTL